MAVTDPPAQDTATAAAPGFWQRLRIGPETPALPEHQDKHTKDALERHKQEGLEFAVRARVVAMLVIGLMVSILTPWPDVIYYLVIIVLFMLIGLAQRRIGKVGTSRAELALLFCDLLLMTIVAAVPNPMSTTFYPAPFHFQFELHKFYFVLLATATLAYSWRTIFAIGTWTSMLWAIGIFGMWFFYTDTDGLSERARSLYPDNGLLADFLDPTQILWDQRIQEIVVFLVCAVILGISVRRSNNLLLAQAAVERERANLARYFSPNVVEQLSNNDEPLKQVAEQDIAVLFVDIVGFTRFSANRAPQEVIRTLREFHALMEREVFRFNGTLDKYLGDGLMATFGTPFARDTDAVDALRAARAMDRVVDDWNETRIAAGQPEIKASFGLHSGPVVLGDIGANRLEFAVIGNTVNVASRLEALSRPLGARIVASDDLIRKAQSQAEGDASPFDKLERQPDQTIRGVDVPLAVWTLS